MVDEVPGTRAGAFVSPRASDEIALDLPVTASPAPGRAPGGVLTGAVREG